MENQGLSFTEQDFIGQEKTDRRKNMAGALAGWLNSMSINPDPNLPQVLQAAQSRRADKIKGNRTVNMLEQAGRTDLADMVKAGTLDPKQAAAQLFAEAGERRAFERQKELARFQAGLKGPAKPTAFESKVALYRASYPDLTDAQVLEKIESVEKAPKTVVSVDYGKEGGPPKSFEFVDKSFAPDAVKWGSGGATDAVKNLNQIRDVVQDINMAVSEGRTTSGPLVGVQNDLVQSFVNPEATDIRNRVQEVVQRNLREILGAQFTQAEGMALIERAYNQRLTPEMNLRRLDALLEQMSTAATAKQQMYEHFMKEGTLYGYRAGATLPTLDQLHGVMDVFDRQQGLDTSDLRPKTSGSSAIQEADKIVGIE